MPVSEIHLRHLPRLVAVLLICSATPSSYARERWSGTIPVTAEVIRSFGITVVPAPDTVFQTVSLGLRSEPSGRHRELIIGPCGAGKIVAPSERDSASAIEGQGVFSFIPGTDPAECIIHTSLTDSSRVVTVIPIGQ